MTRVSVSILDADFLRLGEEIRAVEAAGADAIHLDIMDGHFVSATSYGITVARAVRLATRLPVHTHLMVDDPERFVEWFAPSCDLVTFHIEACPDPAACLAAIGRTGRPAGVALNPDTPIERLRPALPAVADVLVMSVHPGRGGQSFITGALDRIQTIRGMIGNARTTITVDGGVRTDNARTVADAGADILVSGSAIFSSDDYAETIRRLKGER